MSCFFLISVFAVDVAGCLAGFFTHHYILCFDLPRQLYNSPLDRFPQPRFNSVLPFIEAQILNLVRII